MVTREQLSEYLAEYLQVEQYQDYCHNGLQVQGKQKITKLVSGVSANAELFQQASNADAIIVHHGLFWRGELASLTGYQYQRIKKLIQGDINLFAYHLPLDCHLELGNNALLAPKLGISKVTAHTVKGIKNILWQGTITKTTGVALGNKLHSLYGFAPIHIVSNNTNNIQRVAWCTGAAQDYIIDAANLGVNAFITGEISERTAALAQELQLDFFAAGHYATEIAGIQALGEHLAQEFNLEHQFIDVPNRI